MNEEVTNIDTATTTEASVEVTPTEVTQPEAPPPDTAPEEVKPEELKGAIDDMSQDLKQRGVDFDAIGDRYLETGKISDEDLAELEKAGYPKSVVDTFIKGYERQAHEFTNQVYGFVGGESEYAKVTAFVKSQGDASIDAFNTVINTGNLGVIQLALKGIQADMRNAYGTTKRTLMGTDGVGTVGGANQGFSNKAEMNSAIRDSRYGKDKQYTQEVEQKIINTNFNEF